MTESDDRDRRVAMLRGYILAYPREPERWADFVRHLDVTATELDAAMLMANQEKGKIPR